MEERRPIAAALPGGCACRAAAAAGSPRGGRGPTRCQTAVLEPAARAPIATFLTRSAASPLLYHVAGLLAGKEDVVEPAGVGARHRCPVASDWSARGLTASSGTRRGVKSQLLQAQRYLFLVQLQLQRQRRRRNSSRFVLLGTVDVDVAPAVSAAATVPRSAALARAAPVRAATLSTPKHRTWVLWQQNLGLRGRLGHPH